ncbi:hypothetical protein GCM10008940_22340 [Microbulbifer agarilyticus]
MNTQRSQGERKNTFHPTGHARTALKIGSDYTVFDVSFVTIGDTARKLFAQLVDIRGNFPPYCANPQTTT